MLHQPPAPVNRSATPSAVVNGSFPSAAAAALVPALLHPSPIASAPASAGQRSGCSDEAIYLAVIMEKCPDDCSGRYQYRYFDAKNQKQSQRDLNALGKDGFRVLPSALSSRPHLLERDTQARQAFTYRTLDPADAADLEQHLKAPDTQGFLPLHFVWHSGFATAQGLLVLENETTAAANP